MGQSGMPIHPCFREALAVHQSSHTMDDEAYADVMSSLLDSTDGGLAHGLVSMLIGMHDAPRCLVHAVFLAGVLYGRDTPARIPATVDGVDA